MSFVLLGILNAQAAGAGAAGDFALLEAVDLTTTTSSITFSNLGSYSDYKHLQLRSVARGTTSADQTVAQIKFNASNMTQGHQLYGTGSTPVASAPSRVDLWNMPAASSDSGDFGASIVDIYDFNSTSKTKVYRSFFGSKPDNFSRVGQYSGFLNSTSALTSIEIFSDFTSFASGSRFALFGVKG